MSETWGQDSTDKAGRHSEEYNDWNDREDETVEDVAGEKFELNQRDGDD